MLTSLSLFDPAVLAAWAKRARADDFVRQHRVLADVFVALRNTDTGEHIWLAVSEQHAQAGTGPRQVPIWLSSDCPAFADLAQGLPFNRLDRQPRLVVSSDLPAPVENW